jgi:hypothetical protein
VRTSLLDRDSAAAAVSYTAITRFDQMQPTQLIAIIEGHDGVRFVALAESLDGLWARLSAHVRAWSIHQVAGEVHQRIVRALDGGETEAAVKLYFAHAGRWEPEKLLVGALDADGTALFGA